LLRNFEVSGPKSKGRGRKTWAECVTHDLSSGDLDSKAAKIKTEWWNKVVGKPSNPCVHGEADAS